nr:MAG TPA_asm: hypothetical protein [Caudoviricetes sp.]
MEKLSKQAECKVRIFCKYIVKNGKRIYPKVGNVFSFLVDAKKA